MSVGSHCGMSRNERHTLSSFGSPHPSPATFGGRQQAFRMAIYWHRYFGVLVKAVLGMVGSHEGEAF